MLLCRWSANFASLFVVYYRIEQISRLNLACAVFFKVKLTIISTHRHVIVTVPLMKTHLLHVFSHFQTHGDPGAGRGEREEVYWVRTGRWRGRRALCLRDHKHQWRQPWVAAFPCANGCLRGPGNPSVGGKEGENTQALVISPSAGIHATAGGV